MSSFELLLNRVRACELCKQSLPLGPRPIIQLAPDSRILIAGQAPGRKVHESGIPFDDASGNRLRSWLGITSDEFYNPSKIAILPMGFCFPGTGPSGDLPPSPECAPAWREQLLAQLPSLEFIVVIGRYALDYHLPNTNRSVTEHVKSWEEYWPKIVPLPHPSPRNNRWLTRNPWFEADVLPRLKSRVRNTLEKKQ